MATFSQTSGDTPEEARARLVYLGPRIPVSVGLPETWYEALRSKGKTPPRPVIGEALIDTGASLSAIDRALVERLQLPPRGLENIASASGVVTAITYPAQIAFPDTDLPGFTRGDIVALDIARMGVVAIIGRSMLARWHLTYDGPTGSFSVTG